jgi:3-deoxy-D-manno-octulosonate 8-phosphate phosphatase (KDO 8-P phosphatase)
MGDDTADLPLLDLARLAISVADAHPSAKSRAHFVTQAAGGQGAVREACDLILESQSLAAHVRGIEPVGDAQ